MLVTESSFSLWLLRVSFTLVRTAAVHAISITVVINTEHTCEP
uniref:Uncharacterized protein n=1 Tax=Anguilla anguilla TaxID=7936 RepID=A0A0E9QUU4_ANGAN